MADFDPLWSTRRLIEDADFIASRVMQTVDIYWKRSNVSGYKFVLHISTFYVVI